MCLSFSVSVPKSYWIPAEWGNLMKRWETALGSKARNFTEARTLQLEVSTDGKL